MPPIFKTQQMSSQVLDLIVKIIAQPTPECL